jgi:hypothetical protein
LPELIPEIAEELGVDDDHVINLFEDMGGNDLKEYVFFCDGNRCDNTHPTDGGYVYIATRVYALVAKPTPPQPSSEKLSKGINLET